VRLIVMQMGLQGSWTLVHALHRATQSATPLQAACCQHLATNQVIIIIMLPIKP
jgi:hypothetical protein